MKRGFSAEDTLLVWTELYRGLIHHSSLSLLNLQKSRKINPREEFHQYNYIKIPRWRKLCGGICCEKESFPVSSPTFLWGERARGPLQQAPPEGSLPSPGGGLTPFQVWPLLTLQIRCYDSGRGKSRLRHRSQNRSVSQRDCVIHIHSQTAKTNLGHRNLVSLQLWRHCIPQIW